MTKEEKLRAWQREQVELARQNGEHIFMGIPDSWYPQDGHPTYACETGHIFNWYLKSEILGNVCGSCMKRAFIIPPGTNTQHIEKSTQ